MHSVELVPLQATDVAGHIDIALAIFQGHIVVSTERQRQWLARYQFRLSGPSSAQATIVTCESRNTTRAQRAGTTVHHGKEAGVVALPAVGDQSERVCSRQLAIVYETDLLVVEAAASVVGVGVRCRLPTILGNLGSCQRERVLIERLVEIARRDRQGGPIVELDPELRVEQVPLGRTAIAIALGREIAAACDGIHVAILTTRT